MMAIVKQTFDRYLKVLKFDKDNVAEQNQIETLFICCSDWAHSQCVMHKQYRENAFALQNFGNTIAPFGYSDSDQRTLEFCVNVLKVNKIVVCGHTACFAMKYLFSADRSEMNQYWWASVEQTYNIIEQYYSDRDMEAKLNVATQENVLCQLKNLLTYPAVSQAVGQGRIQIEGLVYDSVTGQLHYYDPQEEQFLQSIDPVMSAVV